jgi:hypothetical protein
VLALCLRFVVLVLVWVCNAGFMMITKHTGNGL